MPRKYKRKEGVRPRVCSWTLEQLESAFEEIDKKCMGINKISRTFGIPSKTLRRRYAARNKTRFTLGKHPIFGFENEKKLVNHILKLADAGFPTDKLGIRMLAYQFAEKLELNHNFDHKSQMAGDAWFRSFIERNSELSSQAAKIISRNNTGTLIRNAWARAAMPGNAIGGFRGSGIFPLNVNALPQTGDQISTNMPDTSSLDHQLDQTENIAEVENEQTPQNPIPTLLERESPNILFDSEVLEDISVVDIGDNTQAQFVDSILEKSSPIPQIPLTRARRAKQLADILNSSEKIEEKRDIDEKKKKQGKTTLQKRNETKTTKKKEQLEKTNKKTKDKRQDKKVRKGKPKQKHVSEDNDDDVEASATSAALYKPTLWYYKHLNFLSGNKDPGSDDSDDSDSDSDHDADPVYVKLPRGVKRPASTSIDQEEETETSNNESAAAFGKSVGAQLHHLSKMQRCIAEKLISDVIYHAKMDHLTLDTSINVKESVDDPAIDLLPKAGPSWYDRGLETDTVRQESSSSCNLANIDEDLVKKEMEETENAVNFINYVFDEDEHDDQDEQENSIHIMKEELL